MADMGSSSLRPGTDLAIQAAKVLLLGPGKTRQVSGQGQRHADDLTSNQEVVVRNIGTQLSRVAGIEGATVLGTGQVVLIINPVHLAARGELLHHVAGFVKQRRSAA